MMNFVSAAFEPERTDASGRSIRLLNGCGKVKFSPRCVS
jgi:hypothetical protein